MKKARKAMSFASRISLAGVLDTYIYYISYMYRRYKTCRYVCHDTLTFAMFRCYVWHDSFRGRERRRAWQPDGLLEGLVDAPLLLSGLWPGVEMCFSALQYIAGRCSVV